MSMFTLSTFSSTFLPSAFSGIVFSMSGVGSVILLRSRIPRESRNFFEKWRRWDWAGCSLEKGKNDGKMREEIKMGEDPDIPSSFRTHFRGGEMEWIPHHPLSRERWWRYNGIRNSALRECKEKENMNPCGSPIYYFSNRIKPCVAIST